MTHSSREELWRALLSDRRLYGNPHPPGKYHRSEFQRDYDRILFSSAFRRLQDKTQVFPLSKSDYTRSRMTHSLEVSSVARTLGVLVGRHLRETGIRCEPEEIGTVLATAGIAHDIGNPPFGHSGEEAIRSWANRRLPPITDGKPKVLDWSMLRARRKNPQSVEMAREELADFHLWDGNAQALRIIVRNAARTRTGGLRPTLATIGALAKYPRPAYLREETRPTPVALRKPGYFQSERAMACKAFKMLGMMQLGPDIFSRHPLAFLTEAADDACYAVADIDDALKLGILRYEDARDAVLPIAERDPGFREPGYPDVAGKFARIRASCLAVMLRECCQAFCNSLEELEKGTLEVPLLRRTCIADAHQGMIALAKEKVYRHDRVLQIEYAGFSTIGGLLEMFYCALCDSREPGKDGTLRKLLPIEIVRRKGMSSRLEKSKQDPFEFYLGWMTPYDRLLAVTDHVSGMTDGFAVELYQRLSGIRLPD